MSAKHFLTHLAIAYRHFHPVDEHKRFRAQLSIFEKKQLRRELSKQIDAIEERCRMFVDETDPDAALDILSKIDKFRRRLAAG